MLQDDNRKKATRGTDLSRLFTQITKAAAPLWSMYAVDRANHVARGLLLVGHDMAVRSSLSLTEQYAVRFMARSASFPRASDSELLRATIAGSFSRATRVRPDLEDSTLTVETVGFVCGTGVVLTAVTLMMKDLQRTLRNEHIAWAFQERYQTDNQEDGDK